MLEQQGGEEIDEIGVSPASAAHKGQSILINKGAVPQAVSHEVMSITEFQGEIFRVLISSD